MTMSSSREQEEKEDGQSKPLLALTDSGDEDACPICFVGNIPLACGPCQHRFCQPCVERVLFDSPRHEPHPEDAHLAAPTLGRCPICRSELSLFDLRDSKSGEVVYSKDFDIHQSPLAGSVYVQRYRGLTAGDPIGNESLHFPGDDSEIKLPFLNLEARVEKLDDGTEIPSKKYFDQGCFFHSTTRTFHGCITWAKSKEDPTLLKGSNRWDFLLQLSADLRFIARGLIVKWREPHAGSFPLDGRWKVTWKSPNDEVTTGHLEVVGNAFEYGPFEYVLDLRNKRQPCFEWPLSFTSGILKVIIQTAQSGVDLIEQPQGPPIGGSIMWTTDDPNHPQIIIWERETIGGAPPPVVVRLGPGGKMYQKLHAAGHIDASLPMYHQQSLWGNTFCQGLKVGLASYHFNSTPEEGAYISYEHPLCGQWPPLDDGSPVPTRVPFRNITTTVDGAQRIFRGTIDWTADYSTSWQGMSKWIYEMQFDTEFTCILSGTVRSVAHHTGQEEEMSVFGEDLIYINAAISDSFRERVATGQESSSTSNNNNVSYDLFSRLSRELRQRLVREGASVRTMAMLHHVFVLSLHDDANPIDFNL